MNVEIGGLGRAFPRKGVHKWDFRCSARPLLPESGHAGALAQGGLGDVVLQVLVEVALVAVLAHHEGQLGV
jgi:hypothetical protein